MQKTLTWALICFPSQNLNRALRMKDLGVVDSVSATRQHANYCKQLSRFGFSLLTLPSDTRYPDSVFVEDPAVIIEDTLIITRLRRKERIGEEERIKTILLPFFDKVSSITAPGFIEGGDVLIAKQHLYVGLSKRTNIEGANQLAEIARNLFGYPTTIFKIPESYLHLKGEATYHPSSDTITVSEEIADHFRDSSSRLIVTPSNERFGANCISSKNAILIHKGRVKTKKLLRDLGFDVLEIDLSEFEKVDGAMTCLSKLF
ncbi:MAG: hypothetical protein A3A97_04605 [Candidatus Terrybacteria bacterium RIFCSPLOWO2_01_FULL_40_23]|uniref:Dimethylargininase n=1 Tax=Candidatus Terrybacteria bacterium RIFCSPLOWO2_01_FULL_40_23 TaxID=1802366 RepID=A0A1G2PX50_9BACT|nr:MAG: hypothetical protein A3A97_04605 [Candidatus Terrybacteria bacterium RIFCSPLOWO2_01_FULL_40_23]